MLDFYFCYVEDVEDTLRQLKTACRATLNREGCSGHGLRFLLS